MYYTDQQCDVDSPTNEAFLPSNVFELAAPLVCTQVSSPWVCLASNVCDVNLPGLCFQNPHESTQAMCALYFWLFSFIVLGIYGCLCIYVAKAVKFNRQPRTPESS